MQGSTAMYTRHHPRRLRTGLFQCGLLILILALQINLSRSQTSSAGSGTCNTHQDCGVGYRCRNNSCFRRNCSEMHINTEDDPVCGHNGETYRNKHELRRAECEAATEIGIRNKGECITLPPPPDSLCRAHQRRLRGLSSEEFMNMCNFSRLDQKARAGTLTESDVLPCYQPHCDMNTDEYLPRQCIRIRFQTWCWCSDYLGLAKEGTLNLQRNLPQQTCDRRAQCEYDGQTYRDGEAFTPRSGCGLCQCLNGNVTCFEDYVPETSGNLTSSQLQLLKSEILQAFNFQFNHDEHVLIDIRVIHQHPSEVSGSLKSEILRWKFNYYDRNSDDILQTSEEFIFQMELYEFVRCKTFFDHVSDLIDSDSNGEISFEEWSTFFCTDEGSSDVSSSGSTSTVVNRTRRSIVRKPLHQRSKFYYVLF